VKESESACACLRVCARGLHHRIPFTVSAGGHAPPMGRIKLTNLSPSLRFAHRVIPDVTPGKFVACRPH